MRRPTWDDYYLNIARAVAARADCTRAQHGCVLVTADHRVASTGYNGSVPGGPSCLKGQCPRGRHWPVSSGSMDGGRHCGNDKRDWPCPDAVPSLSEYTNCHAIHAEQNAIAFASRSDTVGGTAYITGQPCDMCGKLLLAAGVSRIVYPGMPNV